MKEEQKEKRPCPTCQYGCLFASDSCKCSCHTLQEEREAIVEKYTTKFWKKYDTKAKPRVMRGCERISKDVVDNFQMMLTEVLLSHEEKVVARVREEIRWSWDIADGTDGWCVQIWYGNTLLDSVTKKSDDGGMVKLADALTLPITDEKT